MRSAALAIAREFTLRHRWGFTGLAGYVLLMVTTDLLIVAGERAARMDASGDLVVFAPQFAATVVVPVSLFVYYFLAAFSFGLSGDLAARESLYPARLFTLPVTTAALAGWPMFFGTATLAGLVLTVIRFVVRPSGVDLPLISPALLVAVAVAWTQVLMWMPYGLRGLRVATATLLLVSLSVAVAIAADRQVAESVVVAWLVPQLPLAFLLARFAVARGRRGEVPDWRRWFSWPARLTSSRPPERAHFTSATHAQRWLEWRQNGVSLPIWVAVLVPVELLFLFIAGTSNASLVVYTLLGALITPPFMAAFTAPRVRSPSPFGGSTGLTAFLTMRPITSGEVIAAKLTTAARSTLAAWLVVLTLIPVALTLSGTWPVVTERARGLSEFAGVPRAIVFALLVLAGLVASTWKQLVQSLYVGLSGREWMLKASACVTLILLLSLEPFVAWVRESAEVQVAIWNGLRWILGGLVAVKLTVAAWIAVRLDRGRLLSDRVLVAGAICWVVTVLALYGVLAWLVSGPLVPQYYLMLLAILSVPLARVSAAPLALAWNRHG